MSNWSCVNVNLFAFLSNQQMSNICLYFSFCKDYRFFFLVFFSGGERRGKRVKECALKYRAPNIMFIRTE